MLLSEAIKDFADRPNLRPESRRTYLADLNAMLRFVGDKPVDTILPIDLTRYLHDVDKREAVQSPHTYNKHVKSVRALFAWLVSLWVIEKSPAGNLETKRTPKNFDKVKAMPELKLSRLLDYVAEGIRGWDPREEATVRFFADTGCRPMSVCFIQWQDVDLTKGEAIIHHQKSRDEPHTVSFGSACRKALIAWRLRQGGGAEGYVFSPNGEQITSSALSQYFRRLGKKAGIGSWGPYSLRHRLGLRAVRQFGVVTAARMLNDTPEVVAQHYARESADYVLSAMRNLSSDLLVPERSNNADSAAEDEFAI